jgi:uncharacterized protein (TIGR02266 family)
MPSSGQGDDHGERRSYPRAPVEIEVSFESESQVFVGLSGDISTGGLFVSTYKPVALDSSVDLAFSLPDGHKVHVSGRVRWLRRATEEGLAPGFGVAFEELSEDDVAHITAFCELRPPLYYEED